MGHAPSAENQSFRTMFNWYIWMSLERIEAQKGVYDWEKIEENNQMKRWKKEGKYIVLRFVLDYPSILLMKIFLLGS